MALAKMIMETNESPKKKKNMKDIVEKNNNQQQNDINKEQKHYNL